MKNKSDIREVEIINEEYDKIDALFEKYHKENLREFNRVMIVVTIVSISLLTIFYML